MASSPQMRVGNPVVRQRAVSLLAILFLLIFAGRLVMIQGVESAALSEQALAQRLVTKEVTTPRADIVDRDGVVLATTVDRYNIGVNQKELATWKRTDDNKVSAEGPIGAAAILAPSWALSQLWLFWVAPLLGAALAALLVRAFGAPAPVPDDSLDLGSAVLPVLARTYWKQAAGVVLALLVLRWVVSRSRR